MLPVENNQDSLHHVDKNNKTFLWSIEYYMFFNVNLKLIY